MIAYAVIAGAGPGGLLLACELRGAGSPPVSPIRPWPATFPGHLLLDLTELRARQGVVRVRVVRADVARADGLHDPPSLCWWQWSAR
jgi:hypothetical protein